VVHGGNDPRLHAAGQVIGDAVHGVAGPAIAHNAPTLPDLSGFTMLAFLFPSTRQVARAFAVALGVQTAAVALMPGIALAHAIVLAAQPAMNSTVALGELALRLHFNSRIDSRRSRLTLQRPDGTEMTVALVPGAPPGVLAGVAKAMEEGRWTLRWQVLSLDGHLTRGEVSFSVDGAAH
jgi:methionine-rich copper-binding protein CopC